MSIPCNRPLRTMLCSICLAAIIAGCSGKPDDEPEFAPVTGVVTLDGTPVKSGIITFIPDANAGTNGPSSTATIGPDGKYELEANAGRAGAAVGSYKVTVHCPEMGSGSPTGEMAAMGPCDIPSKFADETRSGLTAEVKSEDNNIPIEMTSK